MPFVAVCFPVLPLNTRLRRNLIHKPLPSQYGRTHDSLVLASPLDRRLPRDSKDFPMRGRAVWARASGVQEVQRVVGLVMGDRRQHGWAQDLSSREFDVDQFYAGQS
jgi:hypothetical protein